MAPSAALVAIWVLYLVDFLSMFAITAYSRTPPTLRPWLDAPFTMADSVIDLAAVALARGVVLCVLVLALRLRVRSPTPCAPTAGLASLAEPLLDPVADEAGASNGAPATAGDETPAAVRARKVTFRVLLVSRVWLAAQASYVLAKCLARLTLGPPADVALRSVEGLFWAAVGVTASISYFEHTSLSYQVHPAPVAGAPAKPRQTRVRDVLSLCAPDWPLFIQAFFGLAIAAVGESLIPYLYGEILNEIALSKDPNAFRKPMLQLLLTAAATGLATGIRGSTFTVLGARFATRLRQRLLDSLLNAEMAFFDSTKTGEISSRLSADCQKVGDQVELNVNVFVRSLLQVILTTAAMVVINWRLGLVAFISVPPIVVASRVFGSFIRELTKGYQKALADSTAVAEEALGAMRTVRAFAAESEVSAAYGRDMARYRSLVYQEAYAYFGYSALTFTFLPYCCACLVLYYGAQLVHQGGMKPGQLVSFVFYLQALQGSFNSLAFIYTGLTQAVGASDKVFEWIERTPELRPRGNVRKADPAPARGCVELRDVRFSYPTRPGAQVLKGVTIRAEPGEVLALCGASGGGKSSVLALVQRWYDASAAPGSGLDGAFGAVTLDGVDVREYDAKWFHHNVSVVSQEPTLFSRSIRENVLLGLIPTDVAGAAKGRPGVASRGGALGGAGVGSRPWMQDEVERACREANAHNFIMSFPKGYETEVGERGVQLSGGQKQRIAIARALVRRPRVLLLDEATSALDAESEALVQGAIDEMIANSGGQMTVLVIAHRLSTIRNASRIAVISGGVVAELGTHDELVNRPGGAYAQLVRMQLSGGPSSGRVGSRADGFSELGGAESVGARAQPPLCRSALGNPE